MTPPRLANAGNEPADLFAVLRERDVLVHHPYDSFATSVEAFIAQAAADPDVLAIKQTLYRTSGDSPIVASLIQAAEAGKQVAAVVELKARFDEQANIAWARALEEAGVHVVYGLVGLKTHSKAALVVRREEDGIRRYCHIGTGNYNPRTARQYEDLGLLSADPDLGADVGDLFNFLTGYSRYARYRKLVVAPMALRQRITELIEEEAAGRARGPHRHQGERPHRPRRHRLALPRLGGRGAHRPRGAGRLLPAARRAGPVGHDPGAVDRGPLPRALAHLPLRRHRHAAPHAAHRVGRPHGAQPRPPHRGARSRSSTPSSRPGCSRSSTSTWPTTPTPGSSGPTAPGPGCPPVGGHQRPAPAAGAGPRPARRRREPTPWAPRAGLTAGARSPGRAVAVDSSGQPSAESGVGGRRTPRRRRGDDRPRRGAWRRRWRQPSPENRSDR